MGGALFGMPTSFFLTSLLSACGATCCFMLSKIFGRPILSYFFKNKVTTLQNKVLYNNNIYFNAVKSLYPFYLHTYLPEIRLEFFVPCRLEIEQVHCFLFFFTYIFKFFLRWEDGIL